jgi:transketolase C-terminal domain/subunit
MDGLIRDPLGSPSSTRKAYGEALVDLGRVRLDVVVLSADVQRSDFSSMFEAVHPERFINVGIAEPALVDVAVGLAGGGSGPAWGPCAYWSGHGGRRHHGELQEQGE